MTAPLRGTQSLVGQMGWVFGRPALIALEVAWRWVFGIPFLALCWIEARHILAVVPPDTAGLNTVDAQNPWVASVQIARAWALYQPHVATALNWFVPMAALAWVVISGFGRSLVLQRVDPALSSRRSFRPLPVMALQAGWLALLGAAWWGWYRSMAWVSATHITADREPDLIGFAFWAIFLALGFFTAWALVSWPLSIAPLVMLLEDCGPGQALARSLRLEKAFNGKLIEINLVMGIVNLALIVLAMVFAAAPLPFSDQLGADALHEISIAALVFYLLAGDYFQLVRLKGFVEFWKMFRSDGGGLRKSSTASEQTRTSG